MDDDQSALGAQPRARRKIVLFALGASLLMGCMCIPFIHSMMLEDWMHHATMSGALGPAQGVAARAPFDFFIFMEEGAPLSEKTHAFWFAHPDLEVAFWRPLSSGLIAFDHRVFGASPIAFFLHSLLWYATLCAIVAALYARLLPGAPAAVASILFAILGTHHEVVVWSAARNSLVCGVLGGLALLAHVRFRQDGWTAGRWLTPVLFLAAYLGGEAALSVFGFLVAYELVQDGPLAERFKLLLPTLAVTLLWLGLYIAQGYGASYSGEYISPISQPVRYLTALPQRFGFTMSVLLLGMPALSWVLAPGLRLGFATLGVLAVLGLVLPLRRTAQRLPQGEKQGLKWMLVGMLISMLPQLSGSLGPRSYLIPSIGAVALIAQVIVAAFRSSSHLAKVGAGLLVVMHGVLGLLMWPSMSTVYAKLVDLQQSNVEAMGLDASSASERSYLVVTADPLTGYFAPMQFAAETGKSLRYFRLLSVAESDHRIHRLDERTFDLETLDGVFMQTPTERMTRAPEDAFSTGDTVELDDISVKILSLAESGLPDKLRFRIRGDDPLPELWASEKGKMTRFSLGEGESKVIEFAPPL